ncbi:MAG: hypothetical protein F6K55_22385 [Moorea sp. SIO4A3]|nr:hypothetical protein [Moorena sp. SIO4A3]
MPLCKKSQVCKQGSQFYVLKYITDTFPSSNPKTRLCSVDRIPTVELVPIAVNFQLPVIFANKIKNNKK